MDQMVTCNVEAVAHGDKPSELTPNSDVSVNLWRV